MRKLTVTFLCNLTLDPPAITVTTKTPTAEEKFSCTIIQELTLEDPEPPHIYVRTLKSWVKTMTDGTFKRYQLNRLSYSELDKIVAKFEFYSSEFKLTIHKKHDLPFSKLAAIPSLTSPSCAKPLVERKRASDKLHSVYVYADFIKKTIQFNSSKINADNLKHKRLTLIQQVKFGSRPDYDKALSNIKDRLCSTKSINITNQNLQVIDSILRHDNTVGNFKPISHFFDFE